MIETRVRVLSTSDGISFVEATARNGCGACASQANCGISGLGRYFSRRRPPIALACGEVSPGQELLVRVDEGDLLKLGLWVYLLPLVLAMAAAGLATALGAGDGWAVAASGMGLGAGLLAAHLLARAPTLRVSHSEPSIHSGEAP